MANDQVLEGGPVWTTAGFAFDLGCELVAESNARLGVVLAFHAGRESPVSDETIRAWRNGSREAPVWAFRGLWRRLRGQGFTVEQLMVLLGFGFVD
jgi:hypothetical protein